MVAIRLAGPSVVYVKRIIGLPGERVGFVKGVVHVNGVPLDEPYVQLSADLGRAGSDVESNRVLRGGGQSRNARRLP